MLHFLFDKKSAAVRLMEGIGLVLSLLLFQIFFSAEEWTVSDLLYLFVFIQYFFIRTCIWIHWYPGQERGVGIEVHFARLISPASYILAFTAMAYMSGYQLSVVIVSNLALLAMSYLNVMQIWIHFQDKERSFPVNYFTNNKYLKK